MKTASEILRAHLGDYFTEESLLWEKVLLAMEEFASQQSLPLIPLNEFIAASPDMSTRLKNAIEECRQCGVISDYLTSTTTHKLRRARNVGNKTVTEFDELYAEFYNKK